MPISRRPYLIRAIYDWAVDSGYSPHIVVAADQPGVDVPRENVQEGRITLNLSPQAVNALDLAADPICFMARFSGRPYQVSIPSGSVVAIFARETGEGLVFGEPEPEDSPPDDESTPQRGGRPHLRVVK
jgi:stringent starvation protein B